MLFPNMLTAVVPVSLSIINDIVVVFYTTAAAAATQHIGCVIALRELN